MLLQNLNYSLQNHFLNPISAFRMGQGPNQTDVMLKGIMVEALLNYKPNMTEVDLTEEENEGIFSLAIRINNASNSVLLSPEEAKLIKAAILKTHARIVGSVAIRAINTLLVEEGLEGEAAQAQA